MARNDLGTFLRMQREALTPDALGFPGGQRRRTPGLRRAELAAASGISVDYLTRLEQGRDRNPSAQVLAALATTLRLPDDERFQLLVLSKQETGEALLCPTAGPPSDLVRPTVQALVDRLAPGPAYVTNSIGDILTYTSGFARLAEPIGLLDVVRPNLTRYIFTDERAPQAWPDWDGVADELSGQLRHASRPEAATLADELTILSGEAFTHRWEAPARLPTRTGSRRMQHPEVGELQLAYEILELPESVDQRLVVYFPRSEERRVGIDWRSRAPPCKRR